MDRSYRNDVLQTINPAAAAASASAASRASTRCAEIAILTRAGAGAHSRPRRPRPSRARRGGRHRRLHRTGRQAAMFGRPDYVFKDGAPDRARRPAHRDGLGRHPRRAAPPSTAASSARCAAISSATSTVRLDNFAIADGEIEERRPRPPGEVRLVRADARDHQRRRDRGHLRRSLRHDGDASPHHRRIPRNGRATAAASAHRLRDLRHRLRLRGRHRARAERPTRRLTADPASPC